MRSLRYRVRSKRTGGHWFVVYSKWGLFGAVLKFWWKTRKIESPRPGVIL